MKILRVFVYKNVVCAYNNVFIELNNIIEEIDTNKIKLLKMEEIIKDYLGYVFALITLIFGIIQYRGKKKTELETIELQRKYDELKTNKQIKYDTYKNYITKLDDLNNRLLNHMQSEDFLTAVAELNSEAFKSPNNMPEALQKYFNKMNKFIFGWGAEHHRLTQEMSGIRLVCGNEIINLLDEYTRCTKEYVDKTLEFSNAKSILLMFDTNDPQIIYLKDLYQRMNGIRNQLINEMRKEIGIE